MLKLNQAVRFLAGCSLVIVGALLVGCASNTGETKAAAKAEKPAKTAKKAGYKDRQYAANPSKVKFGEFKRAELKLTELAAAQSANKGNQESAKKIDEMLLAGLRSIWPDLKVIPAGGEFTKGGERTLQISPSITDIRLVSVGTRIWFGVMAGGSDLVMHVDYRDSSTGDVIANPDFWKGNDAWSGGMSWGAADNQIRDAVVGQILNYTTGNK